MIIHTDQRGRTESGRFTWRALTEYEPDDYPPDSVYWREACESVQDELRKLLKEEYPVWADMTWPGPEIEEYSWREICKQSEAVLKAVQGGERRLAQLAAIAWETVPAATDFSPYLEHSRHGGY